MSCPSWEADKFSEWPESIDKDLFIERLFKEEIKKDIGNNFRYINNSISYTNDSSQKVIDYLSESAIETDDYFKNNLEFLVNETIVAFKTFDDEMNKLLVKTEENFKNSLKTVQLSITKSIVNLQEDINREFEEHERVMKTAISTCSFASHYAQRTQANVRYNNCKRKLSEGFVDGDTIVKLKCPKVSKVPMNDQTGRFQALIS